MVAPPKILVNFRRSLRVRSKASGASTWRKLLAQACWAWVSLVPDTEADFLRGGGGGSARSVSALTRCRKRLPRVLSPKRDGF